MKSLHELKEFHVKKQGVGFVLRELEEFGKEESVSLLGKAL